MCTPIPFQSIDESFRPYPWVHDSDGNMKTGCSSTRESAVTLTPAPPAK